MKKKGKVLILIAVIVLLAGILTFFIYDAISKDTPTIDVPGIDSLTGENSNTATVTFPEGLSVTQIAEKLEENGVCSKNDFLQAVNNPSDELLREFGITNKQDRIFTLEGYVFPDTYEFYKGENAESVLMRFINNFRSKITEEDKQKAEELGYTMDEIITIASIIQKEAGNDEQDNKVSSVLHNRLDSSTKIQCDVTITYLTDYCEPYLENGLTEDNKNNYNTYKCPALPAGAICNPGYASISAALNPDDTDYMFFVTDKDWNYYYASTWEEHVRNCRTAGIEGY